MFSKTCQYAIRAVIYIASNSNEAKSIGVKDIAESLNVPQQFLSKILQQLVRHNLLSSVKGPNGGFFLTEQNRNCSLLQIVECIDGAMVLNSCILGLPSCSLTNPCPLHHQFFACREGFKATLIGKKVADFYSNHSRS
jgi:Rrf2 family protein